MKKRAKEEEKSNAKIKSGSSSVVVKIEGKQNRKTDKPILPKFLKEDEKDPWTMAYTPRNLEEFPEDTVKEVEQLMNIMVFGLKTIVWCIIKFRRYENK